MVQRNGNEESLDEVVLEVEAKRFQPGGMGLFPWDNPVVGFVPGRLRVMRWGLVFQAAPWYGESDLRVKWRDIMNIVRADDRLQWSWAPRLTVHTRYWAVTFILWEERDRVANVITRFLIKEKPG